MHELLITAFSFLVGLVSGFVAALSSGGGLISIPAMIFLGLSPSSAIATTRLDAFSADLFALFRYKKEKILSNGRLLIPFIAIAIIGGVVGSKLLLQIDEVNLEKAIGILLLLLAPILIFNKGFGLIEKIKSRRHYIIGFIALFLVAIYSAMFGAGGGIFLIYVLVYFFGMTIIQSNANAKLLGLFATVAALVTYISAGAVNFSLGIPLLIGGMIGGYLGAHTAIKKGNKLVRNTLLVIIAVSAIKLIF